MSDMDRYNNWAGWKHSVKKSFGCVTDDTNIQNSNFSLSYSYIFILLVVAMGIGSSGNIGISEVCKEILCSIYIVEFLNYTVKFHIKVFIDNKGSILLDNNPVVKSTKLIHHQHLFVRKFFKEDIVKIQFFSSQDKFQTCSPKMSLKKY